MNVFNFQGASAFSPCSTPSRPHFIQPSSTQSSIMSHALSPPSPPSFTTPTYHSEDDYDDLFSDEDNAPPKGKRLAPVGQAANEDEMSGQICGMLKNESGHFRHDFADFSKSNGNDGCSQELKRRIEEMEEEQEELNNSLMSMTSHFAKVIFSSEFWLTEFSFFLLVRLTFLLIEHWKHKSIYVSAADTLMNLTLELAFTMDPTSNACYEMPNIWKVPSSRTIALYL